MILQKIDVTFFSLLILCSFPISTVTNATSIDDQTHEKKSKKDKAKASKDKDQPSKEQKLIFTIGGLLILFSIYHVATSQGAPALEALYLEEAENYEVFFGDLSKGPSSWQWTKAPEDLSKTIRSLLDNRKQKKTNKVLYQGKTLHIFNCHGVQINIKQNPDGQDEMDKTFAYAGDYMHRSLRKKGTTWTYFKREDGSSDHYHPMLKKVQARPSTTVAWETKKSASQCLNEAEKSAQERVYYQLEKDKIYEGYETQASYCSVFCPAMLQLGDGDEGNWGRVALRPAKLK